jgi:hypothetical protein
MTGMCLVFIFNLYLMFIPGDSKLSPCCFAEEEGTFGVCFVISEVLVDSGMFSWVSNTLALHKASGDVYQVDLYLLTKYKQFTQIEQTQRFLFID